MKVLRHGSNGKPGGKEPRREDAEPSQQPDNFEAWLTTVYRHANVANPVAQYFPSPRTCRRTGAHDSSRYQTLSDGVEDQLREIVQIEFLLKIPAVCLDSVGADIE